MILNRTEFATFKVVFHFPTGFEVPAIFYNAAEAISSAQHHVARGNGSAEVIELKTGRILYPAPVARVA
jgi:hypothetical protein